jgi:hypothetical protein
MSHAQGPVGPARQGEDRRFTARLPSPEKSMLTKWAHGTGSADQEEDAFDR